MEEKIGHKKRHKSHNKSHDISEETENFTNVPVEEAVPMKKHKKPEAGLEEKLDDENQLEHVDQSEKTTKKKKRKHKDANLEEEDQTISVSPKKQIKLQDKNDQELFESNDDSAVQTENSVENIAGESMSIEDQQMLCDKLLAILPKTDSANYINTLKQVDWSKVAFGGFSAEVCQQQWSIMLAKLRKHRTATELICDAKNGMFISSNHPDMPKRPVSTFIRFHIERQRKLRKTNPELTVAEMGRKIAQDFRDLSPEKKQKYLDAYQADLILFKEELEKFYQAHPELAKAKKAMSAMQLFIHKKAQKILKKNPNSSMKELNAKYKDKWQKLSDEKKVKYIRQALAQEQQKEVENENCQSKNPSLPQERHKEVIKKEEWKLLNRLDGVPPEPPQSGYILFVNEKVESGMLDFTAIGHMWSKLSKDEQERYKRKSEKKKARYNKFLLDHPELAERIVQQKMRKNKNKKKPTKQKVQVTKMVFEGEPMKPPNSGYKVFCKEFLLEKSKDGSSSRTNFAEASKKWSQLPADKKRSYAEIFKKAKEKYEKELKAWKLSLSEEQMDLYIKCHSKSPTKKNATKSKKTKVVTKKKITDDNHNNIESADPTNPVQSSVETPVHSVHKETAAALHQISSKKWKHKQNGEASKSEVKKMLNVDDDDFVVEKVARNAPELSHKTPKKKSKSENEDALKGVESLTKSPGNKEDHIEESLSQDAQLSQKTPKKKSKIDREHSSENVELSQESSSKSPKKKLTASQDIFEEVADKSSDDLQLAQKSPKKKTKSVENLLEAVEEISPKKKSKKQRKGKGADAESQLENSYISVANSDHGNQSSQASNVSPRKQKMSKNDSLLHDEAGREGDSGAESEEY